MSQHHCCFLALLEFSVLLLVKMQVCISGAPVTDWLNYDTAYTERYLGLPHDDNDAYSKSSVLQHASDLPSGLVTIV